MIEIKNSIDFIYKEQKELSVFGGVAALIGWDQMTYMPKKGAEEKSEQSALISRLSHEKVISDELWRHIKILTENENLIKLSDRDKAVAKRLEKDVEKARKIPPDFVNRMAKATTLSYQAWERARKEKEFKLFSPHLEEMIDLQKEYCSYINLPGPKYNSLLDDYEEGIRYEKIKEEFDFIKKELTQILSKITSSIIYEKQQKIDIKFSEAEQKDLCNFVIEKMNLNPERSRIDVSTHPFTTSIGNDDVRITTNFGRENPLFSFFSTVHEAGHALYELGLPKNEFKNTVISDSPSLGLHESQSRFWENMIARGKYFWNYFYPFFKETKPDQFKNIDFDSWFTYVNQVKPSLIRVEADELTYCLHVILRFELEYDLIDGDLEVNELSHIWNEKMEQLLGVRPNNDSEGVLQDMHWSGGDFGYFPTYAIGSIYSAQLYNKLIQEKPGIIDEIGNGDFTTVLSWLREHVHKYGRLMTADNIIKNACGEGLNSRVFVDYLKQKYFDIYQL